jgi:hypothetical protein
MKGDKNKAYLEKNLKTAFEYGNRLNKPVIPFVWYMVPSADKKQKREILKKQEMVNYMKLVRHYMWKGNKVKGIFWWEQSGELPEGGKKLMKSLESYSKTSSKKDLIIKEYTKEFLNLK